MVVVPEGRSTDFLNIGDIVKLMNEKQGTGNGNDDSEKEGNGPVIVINREGEIDLGKTYCLNNSSEITRPYTKVQINEYIAKKYSGLPIKEESY